jgi:hypothetical protein
MALNASSIQYPIGQGGLYRCCVHCPAEQEPIDFIYDCGSLSKGHFLHSSIDRLKWEIGERDLDFLVLSHFDADHVNGLDYLLSDGLSVGTVFLPYLTPLQRIVIAVRNPTERGEYYEFLVDPAKFLSDRGVGRIVFVLGDNDSDEPLVPPEDRPSPDGEKGRGLKFPKRPHNWSRVDEDSKDLRASDTLLHGDKVRVGACWQLKFFNYDSFPDSYLSIISRDKAVIKTSDPKLNRWKKFVLAVLDATGLEKLDPHSLVELLRDEAERKKLKEAYKVINKDHNNVSLVLWHGPVYWENGLASCSWMDRLNSMRSQHRDWFSRGGTLLTGDISLKHDFDQFEEHYEELLPLTAFFQVPHHGSSLSWNSRILNLLDRDTVCFTSSGFSNTYGHPHLEVIDDIVPRYNWADGYERCEIHFRFEEF